MQTAKSGGVSANRRNFAAIGFFAIYRKTQHKRYIHTHSVAYTLTTITTTCTHTHMYVTLLLLREIPENHRPPAFVGFRSLRVPGSFLISAGVLAKTTGGQLNPPPPLRRAHVVACVCVRVEKSVRSTAAAAAAVKSPGYQAPAGQTTRSL